LSVRLRPSARQAEAWFVIGGGHSFLAKSRILLLALILLGPVNVVSADADSNLNKELDFVRVVHNQKALEASKARLDKTIFLAQPTVFDPIANGWIAFDSSLKIVGRYKNLRVPVRMPVDVFSKREHHWIGSIGGECQAAFLGMSMCSQIMTWTLRNSVLEQKAFDVSGFRFDNHDLKYVETRGSWLGLGYTLKNCSESPTLCQPLDKQFADCEVVEVSASTGKELNRWSASDHISGDEVGWKSGEPGWEVLTYRFFLIHQGLIRIRSTVIRWTSSPLQAKKVLDRSC
jgi:hypothetical protein